jgi:segregation and condensation protein A
VIESNPTEAVRPDGRAYAVKLPAFEGPLDLLLHLIRSNEVDIADIPIAEISAQYLEYLELMRQLDIDVAAEYLVMAATLAYIKSRLLLPRSDEAGEEEGEDPRAELARRLAEYARFQDAARELDTRPRLRRDVFPGGVDPQSIPKRDGELVVNLFALLQALREVLSRVPAEVAAHHTVALERVTLQDRMVYVMDRLGAEPSGTTLFTDLLLDAETTRHRVVMTFLAILELARIQALRIFQNVTEQGQPFGPVRVRLAVAPDAADAEAAARVEEDSEGAGEEDDV